MTAVPATTTKNLPAVATQGMGLEDAGPGDLALPHLILTQGLSKFVSESDGAIPAGVYVDTLTKKVYRSPSWVDFIPFKMTKYVKLLKPEGNKMVFEARVTSETDARLIGRRFFPEKDASGTKIPANATHVLVILALVDGQPAVIQFAKTSHRCGKELITMAKMAGGDFWGQKYKLAAKKEIKGSDSYFVSTVAVVGPTTQDEQTLARSMYDSLAPKAKDVAGHDAAEAADEEAPF